MDKKKNPKDSEDFNTIGIKTIFGALFLFSVIVYDIMRSNTTFVRGIDMFACIIDACFNPIAWIGIALFISAYRENKRLNKDDNQGESHTATNRDIGKIIRFRFIFACLLAFITISIFFSILVANKKMPSDFAYLWVKYYPIQQLLFLGLNIWYFCSLYQNSKILKRCNATKTRPIFYLLLSLIPYFNIIIGIIVMVKSNKLLKSIP